jgi:surfactin synthase thioesterase subunit
MYLRWQKFLPAWIRVVPLELPGRGKRITEAPVRNFEELCVRLCDEISADLPPRFALFGHSMGAILAYGVTRRLLEFASPLPLALILSANGAPSHRDSARFEGREDDASLIADLRRQGGTPEEVFAHPELLRLVLDLLAADYRVCESIVDEAGLPLPIPIHVLAGRSDDIEPESLEAWKDFTSEAFSLDWFEGGHFYLQKQEGHVLTLIETLLSPQSAVRKTSCI